MINNNIRKRIMHVTNPIEICVYLIWTQFHNSLQH